MGDLRPLGSEKLQGMDKIKRILEIARFKENIPEINENKGAEYSRVLADKKEYQIVKEKVGYIIKRTISESETEYLEPMKNRKYFSSYSQALKKLNLMAKEMNSLHGNDEGMSLFSEQKKFVLKTPGVEKKNPEPSPEVENVPPPPSEPMGSTPPPPPPSPEGMEPPTDMPSSEAEPSTTGDMPMGDMGDMGTEAADDEEGDVTLKVIQKLTGKLGQKLRTFSSSGDEKMSSKDIKYVINSILSALDLSSLEDEDKEEILTKFEDVEADEEMGGEPSMEDEMPAEEPSMEEPATEEMPEGEMTEEGSAWTDFIETAAINSVTGDMEKNAMSTAANEEKELDEDDALIGGIAQEMFTENKVESILKKYFVVEENEKTFNKKLYEERKLHRRMMNAEVLKQVNRLSETVEQEDSARSFLKGKSNVKFVGKTNKLNLVFEVANKRYKITVGGDII